MGPVEFDELEDTALGEDGIGELLFAEFALEFGQEVARHKSTILP